MNNRRPDGLRLRALVAIGLAGFLASAALTVTAPRALRRGTGFWIAAAQEVPEAGQTAGEMPATSEEAGAAPEVVATPESTYQYNVSGSPDPFHPFIVLTTVSLPPVVKEGPVLEGCDLAGPLLQYDLSELRLVATVIEDSGSWAMVEDTLGKGYILTPGNCIGKAGARIVSISPGQVVLQERVRDIYNRIQTTERTLTLPSSEGG